MFTAELLMNEGSTAEDAPDWDFRVRDLMVSLHGRGLLGRATAVTL